jgi:mRNA interferase RelE/StbE
MYELLLDPGPIDFLAKLEKPLRKRIFDKIVAAKENPHHFFERLAGRTDYKLRIGNYRVIADIDDSKKQIHITLIGHRKNVYQK